MEPNSLQFIFGSYGSAPTTTIVVLTMFMLVLLFGGILALRQWSKRTASPGALESGSPPDRMDHLFLKVEYELSEKVRGEGYLRQLSIEGASFVTYDNAPVKGQMINMNLGGVFTNASISGLVRGRVTKTRSLGGFPECWQIDIRFIDRSVEECNKVREVISYSLKSNYRC